MSQLKGEMIFSVRPDYNQNVSDSRHVVPDIEYKFGFDQDSGMQLSVEEIHFHFNKFLRSLGYQIDNSAFENFEDEESQLDLDDDEFDFDEGDDSDGQ
tara:strand:- start:505 stop:798 length:294 start_codon:yes stop_codon:yes gene_type:complete